MEQLIVFSHSIIYFVHLKKYQLLVLVIICILRHFECLAFLYVGIGEKEWRYQVET